MIRQRAERNPQGSKGKGRKGLDVMRESTRSERKRDGAQGPGEAGDWERTGGKPHRAVEEQESPARDQDATMEEVLARANMFEALKRVQENRGSAGVDGMTVEEVAGYLREHWPRLKGELLEGRYRPSPVKRVEIPKGDGGRRALGIPTVIDRVIQQAVNQVLQEKWDPTFSEHSHGFRKNRSAHGAIAEAQRYIKSGLSWVVDIDLERFFDRVNHDRLMAAVARRVTDKRLLRLIRRYLEAGAVLGAGLVKPTDEGVAQGGPLSPLLSNLVLDELDKELERRGLSFVRYADDCNIYVGSERAGLRVMESIGRYLTGRMKLRLNEAKSAVDRPSRRKFLGFSFTIGGRKRRIAPRSIEKVKEKIREQTGRSEGKSLKQVIGSLNAYLRGWYGYYGACEARSILRDLDTWIRHRLRALLWEQWKNNRRRVGELLKRGADRDLVFETIWQRFKAWRGGNSRVMNVVFDKGWFRRQGLFSLYKAAPVVIA